MRVGQLGNDIASDSRHPAHRLDLVFQCAELLPLRRLYEAPKVTEDAAEAPIGKPVLQAVCIHDAFAPIMTCLEPPGLVARRILQAFGIGQSPITEFGAHQRFVPGPYCFAPGSKKPAGAVRQLLHKAIPIAPAIWESGVEMVVRNVSLDMRARGQWRIVYNEPPWVIGFQPPVSLFEPG